MKRSLPLLVMVLVALVASCRENTQPEEGRALRDRIGSTYRSWPRVPGFETRRESATAHGEENDIFWNETADRSARARPFQAMAPGSILVKDAYRDNQLLHVAVMEKRFEGWFWAEWDESGTVLFSGRPGLCVDCHRPGDDFMRAFAPSEAP